MQFRRGFRRLSAWFPSVPSVPSFVSETKTNGTVFGVKVKTKGRGPIEKQHEATIETT